MKRYQTLPAFPYCKWWKAGQGPGTRLGIYYLLTPWVIGVAMDSTKSFEVTSRLQ